MRNQFSAKKTRGLRWRKSMMLPGIIFILIFVVSFRSSVFGKSSDSEEASCVVKSHISSIRDTLDNLNKSIKTGGVKSESAGEIGKKVESFLKSATGDTLEMEIRDFRIENTSIEGNRALVTVKETRKISLRKGYMPGLETGYRTVTDVFVLERAGGTWKINPEETLKLNDLITSGRITRIAEVLNSMGIGRISVFLNDPYLTNLARPFISSVIGKALKNRPSIPELPDSGKDPETSPSPPVPDKSPDEVANPGGENAQRHASICKANLKYLGELVEMYARDHNGRYPESLSQLVPGYLEVLPHCPAAGEDTYSVSYTASVNPNQFEVFCKGKHHVNAGLQENHPSFSSIRGLFPTSETNDVKD